MVAPHHDKAAVASGESIGWMGELTANRHFQRGNGSDAFLWHEAKHYAGHVNNRLSRVSGQVDEIRDDVDAEPLELTEHGLRQQTVPPFLCNA